MYAITGVTGHVGSATAEALLQQGASIRAVVRDPAKGEGWAAKGAEVAVADLTDGAALAAAFRGADGVFVMLPTLPSGADAEHREMADTIAAAVADSGVPHVVVLSSWGAELPEGNGPIRWLHHLENRLRESGAIVSALRVTYFQESIETVLGAVLGAGVYPVFGDRADRPFAMVATQDIGAVAAQRLLGPPAAHEVTDIDGPVCTDQQIADLLGAELGRELEVVTIPREGWVGTLVEAGVTARLAEEIAALYDAEQGGALRPDGDRRVVAPTPLADTVRRVLAAAVAVP